MVDRDRSAGQGSFCEISVSGASKTLSEKLLLVLVTNAQVYMWW